MAHPSCEDLYLAAADSREEAKAAADYVCTGRHDERVIQAAIDECAKTNKNLRFYNGVYRIDGFADFHDGGPLAALRFPNIHREIRVIGQNHEYGFQGTYKDGVVLYVSGEALESIGASPTDVMRSGWTDRGIQNDASLCIENFAVVLANNQHALRCIDLRRTDRPELKNVTLLSYGDGLEDGSVHLEKDPPVPAAGCIGLTMTDGSNYNYSNYTNVFAFGFDEGIQVGGEHVVCINCGAAIGRYGFTFGNYEANCGFNHPITLINCLDERNINLPLFGIWAGDADGKGGRLRGRQEVTLIGFNMERLESLAPGGKLGNLMKEVVPGTWCGSIDFTLQPAWCHLNSVDCQIWENDGSGRGIRTRNNCHKTVCGTEERLSYYPTFGQQIYDTDLDKMLICTDPEHRVWRDYNGNVV